MAMYEGLNHWGFVYASYALGVGGTALLILLSLGGMRRAEARRDASRSNGAREQ